MIDCWTQTYTHRAFEFAAPVVKADHLVSEIANGLAHIARYAGATDTPYSVAQHSVLIAEAIEDETGDPRLAAYGLLHDAHEAYLGDTPSPAKGAIEAEAYASGERASVDEHVTEARVAWMRALRRRVERRLDDVIHAAAGLPPIDDRTREIIKHFDLCALLAERRDLMGPAPRPWAVDAMGLKPLRVRSRRIRPWPPAVAAEHFVESLYVLCPPVRLAAGRTSCLGAAE